MKTNRTIKRLLFTATFLVAGLVGANAQALPANVTISATTTALDSVGRGATGATDLVTKGTIVPYLVYPDKDLNPTWAPGTDASNTTNLVSSFVWTIPGTVSSTTAPTIHYGALSITGSAGATGSLQIQEKSSGACPGSTTSIGLTVVAAPNVTAASVPAATTCASGTNGSLGVTIPTYTLTQSLDAAVSALTTPNVKVKATMTFVPLNGTVSTLFSDKVLNVATTGVITASDITTALGATKLNSWGKYTLTITYVSDGVSRKDISAAGGYFAPSSSVSVDYTVLKAPVTGPIYHLANQ
ncbi:MAG: hypothetical protein Q8928_09765 [Bacteroidota bacterium]|nr:hypothetical protein [Bacteroidota bacterium]